MENKKAVMAKFNQFIELVSHWKNHYIDFGDGITLFRGEIHIIFYIGSFPGSFISEIARNFGVTRAVISKTIKKLETEGYILKTVNPKDKKSVLLYLTDKGWKAFYAHEKFMLANDRYMYDYLDQLNDREVEVIERFIHNARKMIQTHY